MQKKRVLSGTRATGRLHLGNYLGAVKGMLALQDNPDYETYYMVADFHSINTSYEPKELAKETREVVLDYLAAGIDPQKSTIFVQSQVPEHIELSYLFSTVISVARAFHLPTYKEKVKLQPQNVNMALLYYPILMAADILIYKANAVPVGDDQLPHLEIAREVARKMNNKYGLDFPEPKQYKTKGYKIPSLLGVGKMSKSVEGSYIDLTDDLKTIKEKLAKNPTDKGKGDEIPTKGGVATLLSLVDIFEGEEKKKKYEKAYLSSGIHYKELKEELAEAIYEELAPIQKKRALFEKDADKVDKILAEGAERASKVAKATLVEVRKAMGLV
ncbi:tryptophan--tRNA ligase [Candidatus Woesebacteria bacterium]|nr:MAG: tryptophan--tRNA ligase [Candidatus Woesebacteria bacterium]